MILRDSQQGVDHASLFKDTILGYSSPTFVENQIHVQNVFEETFWTTAILKTLIEM